jgi:4-amino-4-deoxy-L-arabinose transferase-like glycosyltransferase
MKRVPFAIAVLLAGVVSIALGVHLHSSRWTMAADEALHSIDCLRLYDDVHQGLMVAFFRDTYFSERWHPPVNNHLRWYPFVHSWVVAASFLVLGPSDFSARLPSAVFLFGSCMLFYALAWRLAPRRQSLSGVIAVLLLLAAPNVVSFFANGLTEASVFFMCYLALLAYVWFLERPDSRARAVLAGMSVAAAILTKYDHGIVLALAMAISEAVRVRFHPARLLRSGAAALLSTAALILGLWFAHPDKTRALLDAAAHPFMGGLYATVAANLTTWFLEYSSDPVVAVLMIVSLFAVYPYRGRSGIMALWLFAVVGVLLLMTKGRFRFRYNIVEAPACLLLVAVLLPEWISTAGQRMLKWGQGAALAMLALGAAGAAVGLRWMFGASDLFSGFARLFVSFYDLNSRHWGLKLDAGHYVEYFATLKGGFEHAEFAILLISAAILLLGLALLLKRGTTPALIAGLAITFIPGAALLYAQASRMADWEIGGAPALHQIAGFVGQHVPQRAEILLAGGWNNFANNSLRWYLLTEFGPRNFEDIHVWGATIGSIVLPAGPRVSYWAGQLETAPPSKLPEAIVLIQPTGQFRYHVDFDQDGVVYRQALAARDVYRLEAAEELPETGCRVEIYRLNPESHAAPVNRAATLPPPVPVGANGWVQTEDPWRRFWNPLLY